MQGLNITIDLYNSTAKSKTFECEFCQIIGIQISGASQQIQQEANPIFNSLNGTTNQIHTTLLNIQGQIVTQINSAQNQLDSVNSQISNIESNINTYWDDGKFYDNYRNPVVIAIFCLPLIALVIYAAGGLFRPLKTNSSSVKKARGCFELDCRSACWFDFEWAWWGIILFFFGIFFAIHIALAMVIGDGCAYLKTQEPTLQTRFSNQIVSVADACLLNTSLLDALNLTHYLNFSNEIQFPNLPNVDTAFAFQKLHALQSNVSALSLSTFDGFNKSCETITFTALNELTFPQFFTLANITLCNPQQFGSRSGQVQVDKAACINCLAERAELQNVLNQIKANTTRVILQATALTNATDIFQTQALTTIHTLLNPIIADGKAVYNLAYCGFLGNAYYQVKVDLCQKTLNAVSYLSLAFFVIEICGFCMAVIALVLKQRMNNPVESKMDIDANTNANAKSNSIGDDKVPLLKPNSTSSDLSMLVEGRSTHADMADSITAVEMERMTPLQQRQILLQGRVMSANI